MFIFNQGASGNRVAAEYHRARRTRIYPDWPNAIREGQRPKNRALEQDPFLPQSNVPGLFAVGDVRRSSVKRVASGVGEGSVAVQFVAINGKSKV